MYGTIQQTACHLSLTNCNLERRLERKFFLVKAPSCRKNWLIDDGDSPPFMALSGETLASEAIERPTPRPAKAANKLVCPNTPKVRGVDRIFGFRPNAARLDLS